MNRNASGWSTASYVKTPDGWVWPTPQVTHSIPDRPLGSSRNVNSAAEELLATAVAWWDTSKYVAGDRFLRNLGYGGSGLDARLGSSIVPNSNDPTYLPWDGRNYLFIPDSNSSLTCVAPATAASYEAYRLDGTVATGSVTGGAVFTFSTAGSWTRIDVLDSSSTIVAQFDISGGQVFTRQSSTTLAVAATASDTTITVASATNIRRGSLIQVNIEQMLVTGISGSVVTVTRGANGSTAAIQAINSPIFLSDIYIDVESVVWSLNRPNLFIVAGSVNRKRAVFVVRPTFLLGTDDYFQIIGNQQQTAFSFGPNQPFTVFASYRPQDQRAGGIGTGAVLIGKGAWTLSASVQNSIFDYENGNGVSFASRQINSSPFVERDEPVTHFGRRARGIGRISDNATPAAFEEVVAGLYTRRDSKNTVPQARRTSNESIMADGEISNRGETRIGFVGTTGNPVASGYCAMEFIAAAVFRKPLTNTEMDLISRYYGSL